MKSPGSTSGSDSEDEPLAKMVRRSNSQQSQSSDGSNQTQTQSASGVKSLTAYAHFFHDTQQSIRNKNASATFDQVSAIVMSMWESLDANSKLIYQKRQEEGKAKLEQSLDEVLPEMLNSTGQSGDTSPPQGDASPPQGDTSPQQEISADSQSLSHPYTDSDDVSFSDPQIMDTDTSVRPASEQNTTNVHANQQAPHTSVNTASHSGLMAERSNSAHSIIKPSLIQLTNTNKPIIVPVISHQTPHTTQNRLPCKVISLDASNKIKVITTAPDNSSTPSSNIVNKRGLTIVNNKATIISQPVTGLTQSAAGVSQSNPSTRAPVKFIITTDQAVKSDTAQDTSNPSSVKVITLVSSNQNKAGIASAAGSDSLSPQPIINTTNTQQQISPDSLTATSNKPQLVVTSALITDIEQPSPAATTPQSHIIEPEKPTHRASESPSPIEQGKKCTLSGCSNPPIKHKKWDEDFCSSKCVVEHTRQSFQAWVARRKGQTLS